MTKLWGIYLYYQVKLMKNSTKLFLLITTVLVILASLSSFIYAAEETETVAVAETAVVENSITSVRILDSRTLVEIQVKLTDEYVESHRTKPVYLFELLPYQSTSNINDYQPVGMLSTAPDVTFDVSFDNTDVRSHAKYIVAEKSDDNVYSIITKAKFIENTEILAKHTADFPKYQSKKGLANN